MLGSGKLICLVLMDDHINKIEFPHLTDEECFNIIVVIKTVSPTMSVLGLGPREKKIIFFYVTFG
jgi:hypothetical protein